VVLCPAPTARHSYSRDNAMMSAKTWRAMNKDRERDISRRERQALEALYRLGRATAAEIRAEMSAPPTYTAVRTHLTNLEQKGYVRFESDGLRYIYEPTVPRGEMGSEVIENALQTFFEDRVELVVGTLLRSKERQLTPGQLEELAQLVENARKEGR
jgi:predicted transcriptional regulator